MGRETAAGSSPAARAGPNAGCDVLANTEGIPRPLAISDCDVDESRIVEEVLVPSRPSAGLGPVRPFRDQVDPIPYGSDRVDAQLETLSVTRGHAKVTPGAVGLGGASTAIFGCEGVVNALASVDYSTTIGNIAFALPDACESPAEIGQRTLAESDWRAHPRGATRRIPAARWGELGLAPIPHS